MWAVLPLLAAAEPWARVDIGLKSGTGGLNQAHVDKLSNVFKALDTDAASQGGMFEHPAEPSDPWAGPRDLPTPSEVHQVSAMWSSTFKVPSGGLWASHGDPVMATPIETAPAAPRVPTGGLWARGPDEFLRAAPVNAQPIEVSEPSHFSASPAAASNFAPLLDRFDSPQPAHTPSGHKASRGLWSSSFKAPLTAAQQKMTIERQAAKWDQVSERYLLSIYPRPAKLFEAPVKTEAPRADKISNLALKTEAPKPVTPAELTASRHGVVPTDLLNKLWAQAEEKPKAALVTSKVTAARVEKEAEEEAAEEENDDEHERSEQRMEMRNEERDESSDKDPILSKLARITHNLHRMASHSSEPEIESPPPTILSEPEPALPAKLALPAAQTVVVPAAKAPEAPAPVEAKVEAKVVPEAEPKMEPKVEPAAAPKVEAKVEPALALSATKAYVAPASVVSASPMTMPAARPEHLFGNDFKRSALLKKIQKGPKLWKPPAMPKMAAMSTHNEPKPRHGGVANLFAKHSLSLASRRSGMQPKAFEYKRDAAGNVAFAFEEPAVKPHENAALLTSSTKAFLKPAVVPEAPKPEVPVPSKEAAPVVASVPAVVEKVAPVAKAAPAPVAPPAAEPTKPTEVVAKAPEKVVAKVEAPVAAKVKAAKPAPAASKAPLSLARVVGQVHISTAKVAERSLADIYRRLPE